MRLRVRFPIRNKLLLLMGTLVVFSIVTYLLLAIKLFRDDKTVLIYELNASSARTLAAEFKSGVLAQIAKVNLLSHGYRNSEWVQVLLQGEEELLGFSLYKKNASGTWERMSFLDHSSSFRELYHLENEDFAALHTRRVPDFASAEADGFWVGVLDRSKWGQVGTFVRKVTFEGETEPSMAVADFSLVRFVEQTKRAGVAHLAIVTSKGEVLASSDAQVMTQGKFSDASLVQQALMSPVALQMSEYDFGGQKVLAAFADVGIGGMKVLSWVPSELAYRAAYRLVNKSILLALFLITLGLFLGARVARTLTGPLSRLVEATQAVQEWRFDRDLVVKTQDEVGALAESFNTMATNLKIQREQMGEMQLKLVLSERLAAVGQVARGVGHEFGNILMRVMGKMDLALADSQEPKVQEHLKVALEALERATVILQNLRSFSKRDSKFGATDLSLVIHQGRSLINHEMRMKHVEWEENLEFKGAVEADAIQLGQVFLNLFINAIHAMPQGGRLRVETRDAGEAVEIRVSDTGTGIPPEVLPKIFEPTFTTKGEQGSGLGLSVSRDILDQHGGEIRVDSRAGQGTLFTLVLPKVPPKPQVEDQPQRATS